MARPREPGCASWRGQRPRHWRGGTRDARPPRSLRTLRAGSAPAAAALCASESLALPLLSPSRPPFLPLAWGSCAAGSAKPPGCPLLERSECHLKSLQPCQHFGRTPAELHLCLFSLSLHRSPVREISQRRRPEKRQLSPPPPPQPGPPEPRAPLKKQEAFFKTAGLPAASFVRVLATSPHPTPSAQNLPSRLSLPAPSSSPGRVSFPRGQSAPYRTARSTWLLGPSALPQIRARPSLPISLTSPGPSIYLPHPEPPSPPPAHPLRRPTATRTSPGA